MPGQSDDSPFGHCVADVVEFAEACGEAGHRGYVYNPASATSLQNDMKKNISLE